MKICISLKHRRYTLTIDETVKAVNEIDSNNSNHHACAAAGVHLRQVDSKHRLAKEEH